MSKENDGKDPSKKRDFSNAFDRGESPSENEVADSMVPSPPDSGASSASTGGSSPESGNASPASSDSGAAADLSPQYAYEPPSGPPPNQKRIYRESKRRNIAAIGNEYRSQVESDLRLAADKSGNEDSQDAKKRVERRRRMGRDIFNEPPPSCKPGNGFDGNNHRRGPGGSGGDDEPPAPLGGGGNRGIVV